MGGLFVVLEGGDGAGKSTQAYRLRRWLEAEGRTVVSTFEPGDTALGKTLRTILLDPATPDPSPRAEALLYSADRAQHLADVIEPALARGDVVVCDRYTDSTIAYQGAGRALAVDELRELCDWTTGGRIPDLTVLLDVAVDEGLSTKSAPDRLEGAGREFHERVRQGFLALAAADPDRYLVLKGRTDRDAIESVIRERVASLLA